MKMRKFTAATLKEAIALVKAELGPDAMIISTRELRRGFRGPTVEVTAAVDSVEPLPEKAPKPAAPPPPPPPVSVTKEIETSIAPLLDELRALREELRPLSESVSDTPLAAELAALRRLLHAETEAHGRVIPDLEELSEEATVARMSDARIVALVGPTGAGKTTTIAKLAARAALDESKKVALLTLDSLRVGGQEQMLIFADLIGAPLISVREPQQLSRAVGTLVDYDYIYIDTAGRSPGARAEIDLTIEALEQVDDIETHLTLAAESRASTIDRWMELYGPGNVDRLLFTKVDEAEDLTQLVRAPVRLDCPVTYLATGQRVPEDLELATKERLLALAKTKSNAQEAA